MKFKFINNWKVKRAWSNKNIVIEGGRMSPYPNRKWLRFRIFGFIFSFQYGSFN